MKRNFILKYDGRQYSAPILLSLSIPFRSLQNFSEWIQSGKMKHVEKIKHLLLFDSFQFSQIQPADVVFMALAVFDFFKKRFYVTFTKFDGNSWFLNFFLFIYLF